MGFFLAKREDARILSSLFIWFGLFLYNSGLDKMYVQRAAMFNSKCSCVYNHNGLNQTNRKKFFLFTGSIQFSGTAVCGCTVKPFAINYICDYETIRLQRYFLWQFSLKGQAVGLLQNLHLAGCIWQTKPCTRAIRPLGAT